MTAVCGWHLVPVSSPILPPGTRLWGRSRIGLRCLEGATRWNVLLPVTVMRQAWVLHSNINAGAVLSSTDAPRLEVDQG